ncbi:hypothetical protein [Kitasatospora sp. NPDC088134]|uniref:hypothetical protein n=1 Tax=Kitasatospora sp. NPDC088134 TaxID=3364071 RepID=UPI0038097986
MKSADTEFIGGPLDGRVLPVLLGMTHSVPKVYRVPVPAHGDNPAATLVYRRAKEYDAKGRFRWRYEYDDPAAPSPVPDSPLSRLPFRVPFGRRSA